MVMVTCPKCKRRFEKSNFPHQDHDKPWCEECLNKYLYDKKA